MTTLILYPKELWIMIIVFIILSVTYYFWIYSVWKKTREEEVRGERVKTK